MQLKLQNNNLDIGNLSFKTLASKIQVCSLNFLNFAFQRSNVVFQRSKHSLRPIVSQQTDKKSLSLHTLGLSHPKATLILT